MVRRLPVVGFGTIQCCYGRLRLAPSNLSSQDGRVNGLSFSPDGQTLASGSFDRTVRLWDVATGTLKSELTAGPTDGVSSLSFSPDGETLASASSDGTVRLWDIENGTLEVKLPVHTNLALSVSFSPDGSTLASASLDGTVRFWDVATSAFKSELIELGHRLGQ